MMLSPGAYTVILAGKDGGTGVGLVEVYDLGQGANSQLANISTRGFVETGDNVMIGGLIVGGGSGGDARVLVRALGASVPVVGALSDPNLELRDASGTLVASNDNWKTRPDGSSQQEEIEATDYSTNQRFGIGSRANTRARQLHRDCPRDEQRHRRRVGRGLQPAVRTARLRTDALAPKPAGRTLGACTRESPQRNIHRHFVLIGSALSAIVCEARGGESHFRCFF